jgi:hypothetical protein
MVCHESQVILRITMVIARPISGSAIHALWLRRRARRTEQCERGSHQQSPALAHPRGDLVDEVQTRRVDSELDPCPRLDRAR